MMQNWYGDAREAQRQSSLAAEAPTTSNVSLILHPESPTASMRRSHRSIHRTPLPHRAWKAKPTRTGGNLPLIIVTHTQDRGRRSRPEQALTRAWRAVIQAICTSLVVHTRRHTTHQRPVHHQHRPLAIRLIFSDHHGLGRDSTWK